MLRGARAQFAVYLCREDRALRIVRTIFEENTESEQGANSFKHNGRMILVLGFEDGESLQASRISNLAAKLETALPGIFPQPDNGFAHMCGTGKSRHTFRQEIERGTTVVHLLEHVILHLLSRSDGRCRGFSGQRSGDLERGITNCHYVVTHYTDKIQALVAADLAFQMVAAWVAGRTVRLDADIIVKAVNDRLGAMLVPDEVAQLG